MPNRPNFPIPDDINAPLQCIQLCIPNEPTYKSVFAGLIYELTYWYNWQRTDGTEGAQCAAVWKEIYNSIDWSIMSCCCPETAIPLTRYTIDGHFQISTDGGTTWTDSPETDPRRPVVEYPPFLPPETEDDKCTYADSVVQLLKVGVVEAMTGASTTTQLFEIIVGALAGIAAALSPTVILSVVVAIIGGICTLILAFSVAAFQALFTSDVWDRLRCNIYTQVSSDGSFTQGGLDAIIARINTDETGLTAQFMAGFFATLTPVMLTNAARSGSGAPSANCDGCEECDSPCVGSWTVYFGTELSNDGCNIQAASDFDGPRPTISMTWDGEHSCIFEAWALLTGTIDDISWQWYLADGSGPFSSIIAPTSQNLQTLVLYDNVGTTAFTASFDFIPP